MKFYFHIPGTELVDGLVFLDNDSKCVKMGDYICVGDVAHIYVEYHGEQDSADSSSCSDFEDELVQLSDAPPAIVTAEATDSEEEVQVVENVTAEASDSEEVLANVQNIMVPDDTGVISQIIVSPVKQRRGRTNVVESELVEDEFAVSQICNPSQAGPTTSQHMPATSQHVAGTSQAIAAPLETNPNVNSDTLPLKKDKAGNALCKKCERSECSVTTFHLCFYFFTFFGFL